MYYFIVWTVFCSSLMLSAFSAQAQNSTAVTSTNASFLSAQVIDSSADDYPLQWTPEQIAWSRQLDGYGQSAPVIWQGQAYVTSVVGPLKDQCLITAVSLASGEPLWQHTEASETPAESTPMISRAAPTPSCDSQGVYAFFETGNLVSLSHAGQLRWQRKLQADVGAFQNKFGLSASLAQTADALYLLIDHEGESNLLALDKSTGAIRWRTPRGKHGHSWTSPAIVMVDGQPVLVCSSIGSIDVYACDSGELLASHSEVGGNSVATPIDWGNGRFLVSSLIRPADGPVEGATRSNLLAALSKKNGQFTIEVKWIAKEARGSFSSPILHRGYCYWINPQGVLFCLDAETGDEYFAKRLPCGGCWASPIAIGDRLYCFGRDGETVVLRVDKTYEELSVGNRLWSEQPSDAASPPTQRGPGYTARPGMYAVLAFDNSLLFRSGNQLYRLNGSHP